MTDSFDSQMDDEDFDAQFEQNSDGDDPEPEEDFEEEPEEEVEEAPEEDEVEEEVEEEAGEEAGEEESDEEFDKPVSEGETVELDIEDLGSKGDGIARVEGFVVFVPGGEVGKSYEVEITSVGRKFAFGEIEEEV